VIALGAAVAGLWALPVFCVPLLLTQLSFRRYAAVRTTYRQTIGSLARATDIAGYTRQGHARRVAELSCAVGRDLGLTGRDLTILEYAALMHDIGQLSLVDPVPEGATEPLAEAEQRRIALLGGAVVRQTGVLSAVADVVERQADPYREQPLPARIVRAVNAYDDLAGDKSSPGAPLDALERLRLGTARDYHPDVVESLARVLARGGLAPAPVG
jgi:HD-GYP domain-containing protein (c-di-GMP phosphodiesterase class II)